MKDGKVHEYEKGWIGVDFDGTLAEYHGWKGAMTFGDPILPMVERVKKWIDDGETVKIITARSAPQNDIPIGFSFEQVREAVSDWCEEHIGHRLEVTHSKDYAMTELWDDRAVQVEMNTGVPVKELLFTDNRYLLNLCKSESEKSKAMQCCGNCEHYDIMPESSDDSLDAYRCFRVHKRPEEGSLATSNAPPHIARENCLKWTPAKWATPAPTADTC